MPNYPTKAERIALCEAKVTLDGKPAKISGYNNDFAMVRWLHNGMGCEFAWPTVALIVSKGGKFSS